MARESRDETPDVQQALSESPGYLLSQASRLLRERTSLVLEPFELTLNDYVVLRLVGLKARLSQGALGDTYGIDPATMVGVIDKLEARKLLSRERNPADRRRYLLRLTPTGSKLLTRVRTSVTKTQKEFLSVISSDEWEHVRAALWKLVQTVESE